MQAVDDIDESSPVPSSCPPTVTMCVSLAEAWPEPSGTERQPEITWYLQNIISSSADGQKTEYTGHSSKGHLIWQANIPGRAISILDSIITITLIMAVSTIYTKPVKG